MSFSEWREIKLGDLVEVSSSKRIYAKEYVDSGIPFYRSKEIIEKSKGNDVSTELYISKERFNELKNKFGAPSLGDILLTSVGTLGVPYIVRKEEFYFKDGNLTWIKNFKDNCHNKFIFYWLLSPDGVYQINTRCIGSTQKALTIDTLKKFELKIPPFEEQKAIAHILSTLDDKIEVNNQIGKTLENMAQAIFKQWFVDFEFPNEDGEPYKSSGGEMVESELGMIPKGWEVKELVDVLETLEAGNRPKGGAGNLTEGIPSIGAENIIGLGKYDYSKEKYVTEEYFAKMNKGKVNPGDVLLYKDGAQLGRKTMFMNGFPHKKCCINSHVFILRTNDMLTQSYLYFWLDQDWVTQSIINLNANSAQPGINQSKLKTLKILTPKFNYVEMFDVIIKSLLNKLFENCIENNALHKTRDALLPKLMSGEIRVPLDEEGDVS